MDRGRWRRHIAVALCILLTVPGCGFQGLTSLPLPGAVGRGADAQTFHVQFANIGTLESNSPVMLDDVVVGSVGKMTFADWHIDVELSVISDAIVPANAMAGIGQTSLLGSMHVALDPPLGQIPTGRLLPGVTIPLDSSAISPSTEQTLSSLSAVVNGGGLGRVGNIIHSFNAALTGRESDLRQLLTRLDRFVRVLDDQRADIIDSMDALNRLSGTFAEQSAVITSAVQEIPPALDVLITQRPRITHALDALRTFSDTSTRLVNDSQDDLVKNLDNLAPTLQALADVGDGLNRALVFATAFPYGQDLIDRGLRGDYMNLFEILDFTVPRLKRSTLLGTRWEEPGAALVPAPGEPYYLDHTYAPLVAPGVQAPATPPTHPEQPAIFAGPYGADSSPAPAAPATPGGR
ncbi:MCE family protein [Mycolicibacterium diernhoferi]|uniref:Mammalian cell entry protein n=4 Tax=Mycolicibacterium diernhoferi TaxID=1801 RepID=A0A1Q4HGS0_9MYCO|nr:MCE family protein [Mycolicibacterium diernhoferi]OJZ66703.1 mammalian cell entry protein [Mycolicibacterium diernhoferi]OPE56402.1 mammalian cell entry protein [Mycolicibacterium diernhoferi]QYL25492.1 MCE family protein [Mycolicibacterium diernhoferi]